MTGAPMLQAAKLWEKTSAKGNTYLIGRLGGVRVLILRNRDAGAEGEPDWHLFFADGAQRAAEESAGPPSAQPPRRAAHRPHQRQAALPSDNDPRPFDDEIPL
jgi:hypothetical protein